jgi:hypothetical protein
VNIIADFADWKVEFHVRKLGTRARAGEASDISQYVTFEPAAFAVRTSTC